MKRILSWILVSLIFGLMLAAAYLPLPVQPYQDFQIIYHADMGLLRGIPLYDHVGQMKIIGDLAGVQPEQVILHPFPYPPWYAMAALPLVLLPIEVAARLWLELNVAMLMFTVWLLTEDWKPWKRLVTFPLALIFLPVLGALLVGQYVFPVLLGMALFVYALKHEKPLLTAIAGALLTFKPHLGALVLLAGLVHLWLQSDTFGRRALWAMIFTGVLLFGVGFLADPAWPLNYLKSLTGFRALEGVTSCDLCVSLPVMLSSLTGAGGIQSGFWLAGILLLTFVGLFLSKNQKQFFPPDWLVGTFALVTLLVSPYLLNYDYVLLLIPLFFMASRALTLGEWSLTGLIYLIPWLGLGLFGRQGNITLVLSTLLMTGWLYQKTPKNS